MSVARSSAARLFAMFAQARTRSDAVLGCRFVPLSLVSSRVCGLNRAHVFCLELQSHVMVLRVALRGAANGADASACSFWDRGKFCNTAPLEIGRPFVRVAIVFRLKFQVFAAHGHGM